MFLSCLGEADFFFFLFYIFGFLTINQSLVI